MTPRSSTLRKASRPEPAPMSGADEEAARQFYAFLAHEGETEIRLINPKHRYAKPPIHRPTDEEAFVQVARDHNGLKEVLAGWAERQEGGSGYADVRRVTVVPLDLDVKEAEGGSVETALALAEAICAWAGEQGFERPLRVLSGTGVHLYWAIPPLSFAAEEDRARFAAGLACLVDQLNEKFDDLPGTEVDPAVKDLPRLMRVPGTLNMKYKPPRATGLVDPLVRVEDKALLEHLLALGEQQRRE